MPNTRTLASRCRSLAVTAALLVALALTLVPALVRPAAAAEPAFLSFPSTEGSAWAVLAGYNTATHSAADANDPYALDLWRTDAGTGGSALLAPISGTVRYVSDRCISIRDAQVTVMMCHVFATQSLRGATVTRGQMLGTVAPDGQAANNGTAHIHLALTANSGGPLPFTGAYAIEGTAMPAITTSNGYANTAFVSTNRARASVDAGADLTVRPGAPVTLTPIRNGATGASVAYGWTQVSGTTVALTPSGNSTTFVAPTRTGTLEFRVAVADGSPELITDTVIVRVATTVASTPVATPLAAPTGSAGRFSATPVFSPGGQALAIYVGGTVAQLEAAARTSNATGIWVQDASGGYQLLVVNGPAFLRDAFAARFASGFAGVVAVTLVR